MKRLAIMGREDFDNGYGGQQIVLDVSYGNDSYRLDFEQVEPQYLSGDWVAKQEGRDYETEFGIADYDYNKDEYNRLADKLVEDGVIEDHDDAYKLVMDSAEPYLDKDGLSPERESDIARNKAVYEDGFNFTDNQAEFIEAFGLKDRIEDVGKEAIIVNLYQTGGNVLDISAPSAESVRDDLLNIGKLKQELFDEAKDNLSNPNRADVNKFSIDERVALLDRFKNDPEYREEIKEGAMQIVDKFDVESEHEYWVGTSIETYGSEFMETFESVHTERDSINKAIITAYKDAYEDTNDEKILEKFDYRIACAETRIESDNKAEDLLRGMTDTQIVQDVSAIKDGCIALPYGYQPERSPYLKEGHQITDEGAANFKCDDTLHYYYEANGWNTPNHDIAINSGDISLLKSYNPEAATKLENLKASCYTPVYVEPTKEAPVDPAVAKAKETGISL